MLLKECPMCGLNKMVEIPDLGYKCTNCDEIFKYDDRYGFDVVSLEEWVEYLNSRKGMGERIDGNLVL